MGRPKIRKNIKINCLECGNEFIKIETSNKKFCNKSCAATYVNKHRGKEHYNLVSKKIAMKNIGKWEDRFGKEKADLYKSNLSKSIKEGYKNNTRSNLGWTYKNKSSKGKTLEEIYGYKKATNIKLKLSKATTGENNPMYGKPSPVGSGNGWSGWYNNWYFRSLLELSYMINVIERFKMKWESAELKKYKIEYKINNIKRNCYCDFVINNKYLVEIKPKVLFNSKLNSIKKIEINKFCEKNNLIYKMIEPKKINKNTMEQLVNNKKVILLDRYKVKFEKTYNN